MKKMRGFTTVELMIVIVIVGLIAAIAIPNVREMNAANRQLAVSTALQATFNTARDSAVTLSRDVTITPLVGSDWNSGWTVIATKYQAMGANGIVKDYDPKTLLTHDALPSQMMLSSDVASFTYNRQGRLVIDASKTIDVCDDRVGEKGRRVTLEPIGRVSVTSVVCE